MPQDAKDIQFAELKDMIAQLNTTIAALTGTIQEKAAAIAKLTEEVSYLRKILFGASFEKRPDIDPNQLSLFDVQEGMEIPVADIEEAEETVVRGAYPPAEEKAHAGRTVCGCHGKQGGCGFPDGRREEMPGMRCGNGFHRDGGHPPGGGVHSREI